MANMFLANMNVRRMKKQPEDSGVEVNSSFLDELEDMWEEKELSSIDEEPEEEKEKNIQMPAANENRESNNHEIRIMWVIDGTVSFTTVFPAVYYRIEAIIKALEKEKKRKNQQGIVITHGLTVMGEEPGYINFPDESCFTKSREKFMEFMRKIKFKGGCADGRENFAGAISQALKALNYDGRDNVSHGLFVFSDSLPKEEELRFNFDTVEKKYKDHGLRFAHIYCYDGEKYIPTFKYENEGENCKNFTNIYTLAEFLELKESEVLDSVNHLAKELFNDCSV